MSILSKMFDNIAAGQDPVKAVETAVSQINAWGAAILAKAPNGVRADVSAAVTDLKGVASGALTLADNLATPIINTAAAAAGVAFNGAVTAYLGAPVDAAISPAALDAIAKIKSGIIDELNALELQFQAELAGTVSGTPVPNPQPAVTVAPSVHPTTPA